MRCFDPYFASHWHGKVHFSFMFFRSFFVVFLRDSTKAHSTHIPSFCRAFGVVRYDSQTHFLPQETSKCGLPAWLASYALPRQVQAPLHHRDFCPWPIGLALPSRPLWPTKPAVFWGTKSVVDQALGTPKPLKKTNWTFHAVKGWVGIFLEHLPIELEKTPRNPKRLLGKKGANPSRFSRRNHPWKYDTLPSTLPSTKTHHFSKCLFFSGGGGWFQKYDCSPQVSLDSISASGINVWQIYLDLVDLYDKLYVYSTYMDLVGMGDFGFKLQFPTTHCFRKTCAPWPGVTVWFNGDNTTNSSSKCSPLTLKLGHGFPWPKLTGQLKKCYPQLLAVPTWRSGTFEPPLVQRCEVSVISIWVFPKMVVPPKHPKMVIFSRKTNSCWVPPFLETPIFSILFAGWHFTLAAFPCSFSSRQK